MKRLRTRLKKTTATHTVAPGEVRSIGEGVCPGRRIAPQQVPLYLLVRITSPHG
jgi:hypothetical protein